MSYYSEAHMDLFVKPEIAEDFRREFKSLESKGEDWIHSNVQYLQMEADRRLQYEDSFGKHYRTETFAVWLREYVEAGRILYVGESMEFWGYEFDGNGRVFPLSYVEKRGEELSG